MRYSVDSSRVFIGSSATDAVSGSVGGKLTAYLDMLGKPVLTIT